jgi:hypothetical protein
MEFGPLPKIRNTYSFLSRTITLSAVENKEGREKYSIKCPKRSEAGILISVEVTIRSISKGSLQFSILSKI